MRLFEQDLPNRTCLVLVLSFASVPFNMGKQHFHFPKERLCLN